MKRTLKIHAPTVVGMTAAALTALAVCLIACRPARGAEPTDPAVRAALALTKPSAKKAACSGCDTCAAALAAAKPPLIGPAPRVVPARCDGSCYCGSACKCAPGVCEKKLCPSAAPAAPAAAPPAAAPAPAASPAYYLINGRLVPVGSYCPPGG